MTTKTEKFQISAEDLSAAIKENSAFEREIVGSFGKGSNKKMVFVFYPFDEENFNRASWRVYDHGVVVLDTQDIREARLKFNELD